MSSQNEREAYFHIKKLFSEPDSSAEPLDPQPKIPFESLKSDYSFSDQKISDLKDSIFQYYIEIYFELCRQFRDTCGENFKEIEEFQNMIEEELHYSLQNTLRMFFVHNEMKNAIDTMDDELNNYVGHINDLLDSKDYRTVWYLHFDYVNKSIAELIVSIHQIRFTEIIYLVNKSHELIQILQHLVTRKYSEYIS